MTGKLTAVAVAKQTKTGRYSDGAGLYLQVSQWGHEGLGLPLYARWQIANHGLGRSRHIQPEEAQERARTARQLLADGIDPLDVRQQKKDTARIEAAKSITFQDAAEKYISAHKAGWKNEKHAEQWRNTLATYAFPVVGALPAALVDTSLVLKVLEPIWTKKPETASRVRGRLESIIDWAAARGYRNGENPARWKGHLDKLLPRKSKIATVRHQPALPYAALPEFIAELSANSSISAKALEFTILTAVRTNETINATWNEIDLDAKLWTIPAGQIKAGAEHRVPLTDRAIEILKSLRESMAARLCFLAPAPSGRSPIWRCWNCCAACGRG